MKVENYFVGKVVYINEGKVIETSIVKIVRPFYIKDYITYDNTMIFDGEHQNIIELAPVSNFIDGYEFGESDIVNIEKKYRNRKGMLLKLN